MDYARQVLHTFSKIKQSLAKVAAMLTEIVTSFSKLLEGSLHHVSLTGQQPIGALIIMYSRLDD